MASTAPTRYSARIFALYTVSSANTLRSLGDIRSPKPDVCDLFDEIHQAIDRDQFARTKVQGLSHSRVHDPQRPLDAIVDEREAPSLASIAPDLDLFPSRWSFAVATLRADRSGAFSRPPANVPLRPVDVVDSGRCGVSRPASRTKVHRHSFAEELLPAVSVFRRRRVGVVLSEPFGVRCSLPVRRIHTRRRTEEEAFHVSLWVAAESMCVETSDESMQARLWVAMKPIPPMSAAKL